MVKKLYLLLLTGEYQPQPASVEAHYMPLLAANRQNLLCATPYFTFAAVVILCLPSVRHLCNTGRPTVLALWRIVRKCQILSKLSESLMCVVFAYLTCCNLASRTISTDFSITTHYICGYLVPIFSPCHGVDTSNKRLIYIYIHLLWNFLPALELCGNCIKPP